MGIIRDFFFGTATTPVMGVANGVSPALVSPWEPVSSVHTLVWHDHFGVTSEVVNRDTAMSVPAVARARHLLVGAIADLPFVIYDETGRLAEQPEWTSRTDGVNSVWHRWAATIDDLLFNGVSIWVRNNDPETGFPIDFAHVPAARWSVNGRGVIEIDQKEVQAKDILVIPGPGQGLLTHGADTIRGARAIEKAWQSRVRTPIPATLFRATDANDVPTDDEIKDLLNKWANARRNSDDPAVGFVPQGLEPIFAPGGDDSQLFIEGRNAIRLDVANHTNIPASLLDGSTATASLTYVTQEGQKSSFHEQTLRYWMSPIEHVLSMDAVLPKGQYGRFDISFHSPVAPEGEPAND